MESADRDPVRRVYKVNSCISSESCTCCVKWNQLHSKGILQGIHILPNETEMLKWDAFLEVNKYQFLELQKELESLQQFIS